MRSRFFMARLQKNFRHLGTEKLKMRTKKLNLRTNK
jgi:hypothetical protein